MLLLSDILRSDGMLRKLRRWLWWLRLRRRVRLWLRPELWPGLWFALRFTVWFAVLLMVWRIGLRWRLWWLRRMRRLLHLDAHLQPAPPHLLSELLVRRLRRLRVVEWIWQLRLWIWRLRTVLRRRIQRLLRTRHGIQ
jgi:hypothetical protein